ncbi:acyltransferase family protein [Flavobacterium franklandianum]|uniref:Acyltransferase n=1 Tax=Flavobacterium franklandianum TaxID=2594430 RepID=A0A553C885_9FLAO|nr:acyltransferase [Flavobacterium franklandianum]TRX16696.1 acyltransferase [Flavobacterium franklandianum]
MKENDKRILIFDIAKGISIILMTIGRYDFINMYPYLMQFQEVALFFRMPTFIFVSGYLFSERLNFKRFLYHKIDGLLKPLISFILSLTLLNIIFYAIVSDVATFNVVLGLIANLARYFYHGSFDGIYVSFWFILALFLGQVTLKGFLEIKGLNKPLNYRLLIAFFVVLFVLNSIKIKFYWTEYIPIFFTYLLIGYSFQKISKRFLNETSFFYSKIMIVFPILFFISIFIMNQLNIKINFSLGGLEFNFHYLLALSLLGVFTVLYLCRYIEKIPILNSFLVYCSKASFYILAFHIFIKDVYYVLFDLKTYNPVLHTLLFISNIILCCLIYRFLQRVPFVRIIFYPIKVIVLNKDEIRLLKSKYINRFIPKDIFLDIVVR